MKIFRKIVLVIISILAILFLIYWNHLIRNVNLPDDQTEIINISTDIHHDLERTYLSAIHQAKKSILIAVYSITDKEVIKALKKKSEEGVPIFLITHQENSYDIEKRLGKKVKILKRFGKGLMHLKIMVVDDSICFVGSANLTFASLKMYGNLVTAFKSEELANYLSEKILSMGEYKNHQNFPSQSFKIANQFVEFYFLPDEKNASKRIKELIRSAKKSIRIAMFTWTRTDFAKEIIRKSLEGVKVEVILDKSSSTGSSYQIFELLKHSSVLLRVNKGSELLHYKFLYLDESILVNGSLNWTRNAFKSNDDCFFIIHDLTQKQKEEMNQLFETILLNSQGI